MLAALLLAGIVAAPRQPARAGAQRAAGDGHRHPAGPAAQRLPAVRGHPHRRQHRRRVPVAPGRGLVRAAPGQVRAPGGLARVQVRRAELCAPRADRSPRRADRRGRLGLSDRAGVPAPLRPAFTDPVDRLRPGAAGLPRLAVRPLLPAAATTPTSTSSPCHSHRATSTTVRSSPGRWASSAGSRWTSWAAGTSGASPKTPSCRCACCGPAGRACTWTSRGASASCR